MMQGSIYIYAMDGTPLETGKPAIAMAINSKIGIVTGLTLDPIKKVTKSLMFCRDLTLIFQVGVLVGRNERSTAVLLLHR